MNQLNANAPMHSASPETLKLREKILAYSRERMDMDPAPLDHPQTPEALLAAAGKTITETGIGGEQAFATFANVLAPSCLSVDHPGYLAFIPCAPTEAASLFDLVVSASSIYGGSWLEGSGSVFAENQVLSWLAQEVGLPGTSGGVFVQGGTLGNLSALVAARHNVSRLRLPGTEVLDSELTIVCSAEAHSSLKTAAAVMGVRLAKVPVDDDGRMRGEATARVIGEIGADKVFAVVATAGTTNLGIVDRLDEVGQIAKANDIWFHIDGAYGLAGILAPESRHLFRGSELADSFIVDPHKWLFAPFDACALIYRNPELARQAHTQHAEYLDSLTESDDWNPSDYAIGLTRRARGLPFWFSLASHGVGAYRSAIAQNIATAKAISAEIHKRPGFALCRQPDLAIVGFTRQGWALADYERWGNRMLREGKAFVVPSALNGEPIMRFAIVNPLTTFDLLCDLLDEMDAE